MPVSRARPVRHVALVLVAACLAACGDATPTSDIAAQQFLEGWFARTRAPIEPDNMCHGLGMLKHSTFACAEIVAHAGRVTPASRTLTRAVTRDCFESVCGTFMELEYSGTDLAGNGVDEHIIVKRDDGQFRVYWYRSTTLLEAYRQAHPELAEVDAPDPLQVAYDELTARHSDLYAWPPCYGIRATSNNLRTPTMALDAIDAELMATEATACPETFCFALVGQKIAGLCP